MKKIVASFLLTVVFFNFNCAETAKKSDEIIHIENFIREYSAVFDAKDFEKFSTYCTDGMKFYTLDGQVFNRETMVPFLRRMMKRWQNLSTEIEALETEFSTEVAWARYKQVIHYTTAEKNGAMHNLISVGLIKENNGWKIGHFHMSTSY